ncbi:MAG: cytochrome c peroxidase [Pirellulaceae bacterium]
MKRFLYFLLLTMAYDATSLARADEYGREEAEPAPREIKSEAEGGRLRYPQAMVLSRDGKTLYVANRRTGSLSIVDAAARKLVGEFPLGRMLTDLAALPDGRLLAVDEQAHQLLTIETAAGNVRVIQRTDVARHPVGVAVSHDGRHGYVTSLWSRRLTILKLADKADQPHRTLHVVDLPFAPRCVLPMADREKLIVADSFGGRLGVVDPRAGELLLVRDFPGHNIRGLGVSTNRNMLLVSHQMLNELAHTVRNDVHWGLLMSNDLRWLQLDNVLSDKANLYERGHMHPLGEAGSATSDPAGLAVAPSGMVVVTLAGVGEIAIGIENDFSLQRIRVGRRPTAVVISPDSRWAYVANTFDDTISIVDLKERENVGTISLGPLRELTEVERGELLFYDARLSHDSWMSCNSCHTDGHTNGLLSDNLSDKSFGAPKRVLSLLGRAGTEPFAWNGSSADYGEQIRKSISLTMQGDETPADRNVEALAAFLATLEPPPSIDDARGTRDEKAVRRGQAVFKAQNCNRCHQAPNYTSPELYDVGLTDKEGNKEFNPPTLRGVGQRGPYFHDASAASLRDVFEIHGHQLQSDLSDRQLSDLLAFLRSL